MFSSRAVREVETFPEAAEALQLVYLPVGLHGAAVAPSNAAQVHLGLESNLHHVSGLCKGHGHGTRSAAGQNADQNARVCRGENSTADAFRQTHAVYFTEIVLIQKCLNALRSCLIFFHTVTSP